MCLPDNFKQFKFIVNFATFLSDIAAFGSYVDLKTIFLVANLPGTFQFQATQDQPMQHVHQSIQRQMQQPIQQMWQANQPTYQQVPQARSQFQQVTSHLPDQATLLYMQGPKLGCISSSETTTSTTFYSLMPSVLMDPSSVASVDFLFGSLIHALPNMSAHESYSNINTPSPSCQRPAEMTTPNRSSHRRHLLCYHLSANAEFFQALLKDFDSSKNN